MHVDLIVLNEIYNREFNKESEFDRESCCEMVLTSPSKDQMSLRNLYVVHYPIDIMERILWSFYAYMEVKWDSFEWR